MVALKSALSYVTASTTDQHMSGLAINFNTSGMKIVIPGVPGEQIYVYKYFLVVAVATELTFYDGVTALTGPIALTDNEAMVFTFDTRPWYETDTGNDLIINNSQNSQVSGRIYFIQG